jgi:hypothetical protein
MELEQRWRERFQEFNRSGLPVREYCRSRALKEHTFFWWRRALAKRDRLRQTAHSNPIQFDHHSVARSVERLTAGAVRAANLALTHARRPHFFLCNSSPNH